MMRAVVLLSALLLSACLATTPAVTQRYPMEIAALGAPSDFPLRVGNYVRLKTLSFAPGNRNVSVGYNHDDPILQNAVTLYFFPAPEPLEQRFEAEVAGVLDAHERSELVRKAEVALDKNGVSYPGRVAEFRYREDFAQENQELFSLLILVELSDRYFKVRSSAPADQAELAENGTMHLLESVNWAY